jgi:hypothetical protein
LALRCFLGHFAQWQLELLLQHLTLVHLWRRKDTIVPLRLHLLSARNATMELLVPTRSIFTIHFSSISCWEAKNLDLRFQLHWLIPTLLLLQ